MAIRTAGVTASATGARTTSRMWEIFSDKDASPTEERAECRLTGYEFSVRCNEGLGGELGTDRVHGLHLKPGTSFTPGPVGWTWRFSHALEGDDGRGRAEEVH